MKKALPDDLKFMHRCPDCGGYASGMTTTHPWRLYCSKCRQELQNPDHPEYYPESHKDNLTKALSKAERGL